MARDEEPPVEYLPSTTRAVAWGALFFSIIACCISLATLFLTYKDGRMIRNLQELTSAVKHAVGDVRKPAAADDPTAQLIDKTKMRENLAKVEEMIRSGNSDARYHLDKLMDEMRPLRDNTSRKTAEWAEKSLTTLKSARDQIGKDGPAAAQKLKNLAEEVNRLRLLRNALGGGQATPQAEETGAQAEAEPAASEPEASPPAEASPAK